jgi:hypothetical protein
MRRPSGTAVAEAEGYSAMAKNVTQKLIACHWVESRMKPGEEIDLWKTSS